MPHGNLTGGWLLLILIVGGGGYLLLEHPWIFWLIALPVAVLAVCAFISWLKK